MYYFRGICNISSRCLKAMPFTEDLWTSYETFMEIWPTPVLALDAQVEKMAMVCIYYGGMVGVFNYFHWLTDWLTI